MTAPLPAPRSRYTGYHQRDVPAPDPELTSVTPEPDITLRRRHGRAVRGAVLRSAGLPLQAREAAVDAVRQYALGPEGAVEG